MEPPAPNRIISLMALPPVTALAMLISPRLLAVEVKGEHGPRFLDRRSWMSRSKRPKTTPSSSRGSAHDLDDSIAHIAIGPNITYARRPCSQSDPAARRPTP